MSIKTRPAKWIFLWAIAAMTGSAAAAPQPLIVRIDQSQLLTVQQQIGTVVIGNPGVVDASLTGTRLFLHGRSFGTTNLILLDPKGNEFANYEVTVQQGGSYNLSMYKAGGEYSYVCAPDCELQMHAGDMADHFKSAKDQAKDMIDFASGQKAADSSQQNQTPSP